MTWAQTLSDRAFDLLNPQPDQVCAEDIAHGLSLQCRFNGQVQRFYSVAEHSVRVSRLARSYVETWPTKDGKFRYELCALLHDAHEAYVGDIIAPLKGQLDGLSMIETQIQLAIEQRFICSAVPPAVRQMIKRCDMVMLATEKRDLMGPEPRPWIDLPPPLDERIEPWPMWRARQVFSERLNWLLALSATAREAEGP